MRHGSLFSGIGGFDLAAEWMGWQNIFHCEWNEFGQKLLKHYWPKAISYHDITKADFSIHRGAIDILTGGFPCQPFSVAGDQKGTEDERHLWPEMLRAIREVQPRFVVGENVPGIINWNRGLVFEQVQSDLEAQGYEITPFLLPACSQDAPHQRDRIWFIAFNSEFSTDGEYNQAESRGKGLDMERLSMVQTGRNESANNVKPSNTNVTNSKGEWTRRIRNEIEAKGTYGRNELLRIKPGIPNWSSWPNESPFCNGDDGIPVELDGITLSNWRNESIKAGGNAIVPQVAYQIFKAINQFQQLSIQGQI